MHAKIFFKKFLYDKLISLFFLSSSLYSFNPADYVSEENNVYIEIAPMEITSQKLENFLVSITGPQLLETLKAQLAFELGIDLFNKEELSKIGFDTKSPVAISGIWGEKKSFAIYLPAQNPQKLYDFFKKAAQEYSKKDNLQEQNLEENEFQEFDENEETELKQEVLEKKPNELFEIRRGEQITYFAKAEEFVFITTDEQNLAKALKTASKPISQTMYFISLKEHYQKKNKGEFPILSFYLHPSLLRKIGEQSLQLYGERLSHALTEEMEKNILGIGGFWGFEKKKSTLSFIYLYQKGYLKDNKSLMGRILQAPSENLSLDFYPTRPLLLISLRLYLPALLDFLFENDIELKQKLDMVNQKLRAEHKVDLNEDFLRTFQGSMVALLTSLPQEKDLKSYLSWEWYASLGIFPGKSAALDKFFMALSKSSVKKKRRDEMEVRVKKVGQKNLYIVNLNTKAKSNGQDVIYLMVKENELLLSGRESIAKELPRGKNNLIEQVSGLKNPHAFFYLNLSQLVEYAAKSSFKAFIAPYLPYLRSLSSAFLASSVEGDLTFTDFTILLK